MPDIWTNNADKFRNVLKELGAVCGGEPRVLKPRDPEWTCYIDSKGWLRDVYIHSVPEFFQTKEFYSVLIVALGIGILLGLAWGKLFWKTNPARS